MPVATICAPLLLAGVLALAAASKWGDRASLVSVTRQLRLPARVGALARAVPGVEVLLAAGLLLAPWPVAPVVATAVLGLMLAYTFVVVRGVRMTPRPSCGCFGRAGVPLTGRTVARNLVLTGLAAATLAWTLTGSSVPDAVLGSATPLAWLAALLVTVLVGGMVASEQAAPTVTDARPDASPPTDPRTAADPSTPELTEDDYVREPIPPGVLMTDDWPVSLASLARTRAQLLVWVACGCGRSHTAVQAAQRWAADLPEIDVRMVSTATKTRTAGNFPEHEQWLYDVDATILRSLGVRGDPVAMVLGADGLLAGGPVVGEAEVLAFGADVVDQIVTARGLPTVTA